MISQARAMGLNVSLFPTPNFPASADSSTAPYTSFWLGAPRDAQWWQTWFTRYRAFAINYADLPPTAATLILGGDWVAPALPGGNCGWQSSTSQMWKRSKSIIADAWHFNQVLWALPYTSHP
jgi:hypothetical protein